MSTSLRDVAERARDASAGLQIFLDNIPQRDFGIRESVYEFALLNKGILKLHMSLSMAQDSFTPALREDIYLLLRSMNLTMDRVDKMFGDTKNLKLDGRRPYQYVWTELCNDFKENEGQFQLPSRLQLYSLFLNQILGYLKG
jgi:hypothetical protein